MASAAESSTVVVASHNPVKLRAVERAFGRVLPGAAPNVAPVSVASGVSDQPASDSETRRGAIQRAHNARDASPDADYWVGLEGGVDRIDDQLTAFAWMAIVDRQAREGIARTVTLPLPPAVATLMDQGLELGEANDRVFATTNSKQQGGAFGLLTNGAYTRESVYVEALVVALIPLTHPLFK